MLPGSTGVIGVPLPIERLETACAEAPASLESTPGAIERFARAIMTTDTRPKWISLAVGPATLTGIAKGAGMIEPNMATMLAYFFTDAELPAETLQGSQSIQQHGLSPFRKRNQPGSAHQDPRD